MHRSRSTRLRCQNADLAAVIVFFWNARSPHCFQCGLLVFFDIIRRSYVFGRPCSDLLSQALRLSTIGAEEFDGRVRDGIGSWAPRKNHKVSEKRMSEFWFCYSDIAFPCKKQCLVYF